MYALIAWLHFTTLATAHALAQRFTRRPTSPAEARTTYVVAWSMWWSLTWFLGLPTLLGHYLLRGPDHALPFLLAAATAGIALRLDRPTGALDESPQLHRDGLTAATLVFGGLAATPVLGLGAYVLLAVAGIPLPALLWLGLFAVTAHAYLAFLYLAGRKALAWRPRARHVSTCSSSQPSPPSPLPTKTSSRPSVAWRPPQPD